MQTFIIFFIKFGIFLLLLVGGGGVRVPLNLIKLIALFSIPFFTCLQSVGGS